MATRIQIRRDTSTNWENNNPVLALGEPGLETDTLIVKYGDGSSAWNSLPYANIDSLSDFTTSDLTEGSRLYYSNARVYANILTLGHATNAQLATYVTNTQLATYVTNAQLAIYVTNAQLTAITTSSVSEGTNLYYSNARVYANVLSLDHATNAQLALYSTNAQLATYATNAQLATYSTNAQLTLYATNAQLINYVTTGALLTTTTAGIAESGNLYYTDARVYSNVETIGYAANSFVVNQLSQIYYPAVARLSVTNSGASGYLFNSHYSGNNPNVYTLSGTTISFALDVSGHPFLLQEDSGVGFANITSTSQLFHISTTGTLSTGGSAQGKVSGTLYWNVPYLGCTSSTFRYICSVHSNMVGNVIVKDISVI